MDLAQILDRPDVQAAIANLSERVANQVTDEQGGHASASYHEYVDEVTADAIERLLRSMSVDDFSDWADGELDAKADLQRDRAAGL
jgi:hypothetical protein